MKKLLLTALIAAMMALPLGTVAMADDKPISESPTVNEAYIPGEAPAQSDTRPGTTARKDTPGSISFVPAAAGLVLAGAVIRDLGQF